MAIYVGGFWRKVQLSFKADPQLLFLRTDTSQLVDDKSNMLVIPKPNSIETSFINSYNNILRDKDSYSLTARGRFGHIQPPDTYHDLKDFKK